MVRRRRRTSKCCKCKECKANGQLKKGDTIRGKRVIKSNK